MKGPFCPGQTGAARGTRFQSPVSWFQFAAGLSKTGQTRVCPVLTSQASPFYYGQDAR
jgi:hypothetical protein